ncbi:Very-long-chain (3R)-3-hydroxyacyl-[acyl-carrier protein] dehydratase PASTICCINO 2B [Apostasia shenzhenica]|uniref:Very-long-chain (3R)-3-hydroxyacyl-CoA dehydratase n=1 Tax=Apostasia shenzhenica TaxID=1088818 RepID=A0A2I0B648_9ASPA|nr:Very-long-chain (3R)-3-hydroxyacyl-[acyl-carrier protein] dehydratase PASTICCINO 2B [Apostasia shenzhenica]
MCAAQISLSSSPSPRDCGRFSVSAIIATMFRASKLYLLFYNLLQCLGWSLALVSLLRVLFTTLSVRGAYAAAGDLICFLQSVSFLEVVHSALGLIRSGVVLTLLQATGRIHFLLSIVRQIVEVQGHHAVFITLMAWSISEVIRYSHYTSTILGICPSWLTYLRYTAFIVLYPIGVAPGEMWLMYRALPYIKEKNLYSSFFSKAFISYHTFVLVVLMLYPVLWLKLYLHLFEQRRLKLGRHRTKQS